MPSPFILRWIAAAIAAAWFLAVLTSDFLTIANQYGLVAALDTGQIEGPPQTVVTTQADCGRRQTAHTGATFMFCSPGVSRVPIFTLSLKLLTGVALIPFLGFMFLAGYRERQAKPSN